MSLGFLNRDAFEKHLDTSWQSFRQQLLDVYPSIPSIQSIEIMEASPVDSEHRSAEIGGFEVTTLVLPSDPPPAAGDSANTSFDEPVEDAEASPADACQASWDSMDSDDISADDKGLLLSGLGGLSEDEVTGVKDRLRLRLGILSPKTLVSGKTLLDAVAALGLTRYTEEDMNEFVNMLGDFISLEFEAKPQKRTNQTNESTGTSSVNSLFFGHEAPEPLDTKLGKPHWQWPNPMSSQSSPNVRSSASMKNGAVSNVIGQQSRAPVLYNMVPAQPLLDIFLAQETDVHKRIFGAKGLNQYRAMKEILLAGDTNRLVAELTFVRINDLAAPPEPMHPIMYLEPLVAILIVGNGIMIGFQTDPSYKEWNGWVYFEIGFAICWALSMLHTESTVASQAKHL